MVLIWSTNLAGSRTFEKAMVKNWTVSKGLGPSADRSKFGSFKFTLFSRRHFVSSWFHLLDTCAMGSQKSHTWKTFGSLTLLLIVWVFRIKTSSVDGGERGLSAYHLWRTHKNKMLIFQEAEQLRSIWQDAFSSTISTDYQLGSVLVEMTRRYCHPMRRHTNYSCHLGADAFNNSLKHIAYWQLGFRFLPS